ncbi:LINE-1 type transposase domain-containing protein 1 [Aotus nancymaae]|uniref:LINE-1 type transposase domain-containing protein 1 n=1 Tax=Aotus nancymaae TaxID=37293 RepID=UPI0030FE38E0
MSDVSSMSSVQSKFARLAKKQENVTYMERRQLIETDEEMAPIIDLKCMDVSAVIMNKFKILMEIQDQMFEEMRETLKNDLKAILGAKTTIPEVRNSENSSGRTEFQQIINSVSQKTGKVGKIERESSKIVADTENLTFKIKEVDELSGKLDNPNEYNSNEGKKLPQNESRIYKFMGSMEETLCNIDDRQRNCHSHLELTEGESRENGEDEFLEVREERKIPKFKNKEKILKASREEKMLMDEGTVLTLAADLSSATLDVSKQWSNVFNILREHDFEPEFLCDVKLAFKCDGEIKTFSDLQSLRKFASQKSSMKELLKEVLLQKEEINRGGRYGIQEKRGKTLLDSKHRAGEMTSDGLNFLFIKEVKVAKLEGMNNLETQEEEFSELELLDEEGSGIEDDGEETSELEEEEEEASGLEEEEEEEEEQSSVFCKETEEERHKTLQTEKLTSKEADLTQEIENLSSVVNSIREIQEEIGNLKSSHPGVLEIKNSVGDLSSRMDLLEEKIDSLEDQIEEFSKDTVQMTKQIIHKERQREIEDRSRSANIRLIGIPEKENNENGAADIINEIIDENFAELKKGSSLEIVSACRVPSKIDEKRLTPRHILVKFSNSNDKAKIIGASRERREITYRGRRIRLTADLSLDTLDARSKWSNIFRVLLEKGFNPRILYPAKLAFDFGGKTKVFLDIEEFRDYVSHMPTLRELLENILQ